MPVSFDPTLQFWKNLSGPVPGGMAIIKALTAVLPNGTELDWTSSKELGVHVIWKRTEPNENVHLVGFDRNGMIYTDTPVKTVFGHSKDGLQRAFALLTQFTKDLATSVGHQTRIDDSFATRIPTASFAKKDGRPPNLKSVSIDDLLGWPDAMRRFMATVEGSDAAGAGASRAAYLKFLIAETGEREKSAETETAMSSPVDRQIAQDLGDTEPEGMTHEMWVTVRQRASRMARKFARERGAAGTLQCDQCQFDPAIRLANTSVLLRSYRSAFDVHHKHPLALGERDTAISDFALMCPTCHRVRHLILNADKKAITDASSPADKT